MSRKEELLYPEISEWFQKYLEEKYKGYSVHTSHKTSRLTLDTYLRQVGADLKEARGLSIKVDIVAVLKRAKQFKLAFIEVKGKPLTLADLGQLWGYTQLIRPVESFLISSEGIGVLEYILNVLKREDILIYGANPRKMMNVCRWDENRKCIDYKTLIPKL
jgi:hypothetical protein